MRLIDHLLCLIQIWPWGSFTIEERAFSWTSMSINYSHLTLIFLLTHMIIALLWVILSNCVHFLKPQTQFLSQRRVSQNLIIVTLAPLLIWVLMSKQVLSAQFIKDGGINSGLPLFLYINKGPNLPVLILEIGHVAGCSRSARIVHLDLTKLLLPVSHLVLLVMIADNSFQPLSLVRLNYNIA
jgi:hypothetical protein